MKTLYFNEFQLVLDFIVNFQWLAKRQTSQQSATSVLLCIMLICIWTKTQKAILTISCQIFLSEFNRQLIYANMKLRTHLHLYVYNKSEYIDQRLCLNFAKCVIFRACQLLVLCLRRVCWRFQYLWCNYVGVLTYTHTLHFCLCKALQSKYIVLRFETNFLLIFKRFTCRRCLDYNLFKILFLKLIVFIKKNII